MTDMTHEQALIMDLRNRLLNETANPVCCGQYDDDPNGGPLCCGKPEADIPEDVAALVARADEALSRPAVPEVTDEMALAFHRAIGDGSLGQSDVDDIKAGLRRVFESFGAPAPAVPEGMSADQAAIVERAFMEGLNAGFDRQYHFDPAKIWSDSKTKRRLDAMLVAPALPNMIDAFNGDAEMPRPSDFGHANSPTAEESSGDAGEPASVRCPHGIRHPHPCRECEDAPLTEEAMAAYAYMVIADLLEPHIQRPERPAGSLPASVTESVQMLLDHWLATRGDHFRDATKMMGSVTIPRSMYDRLIELLKADEKSWGHQPLRVAREIALADLQSAEGDSE